MYEDITKNLDGSYEVLHLNRNSHEQQHMAYYTGSLSISQELS